MLQQARFLYKRVFVLDIHYAVLILPILLLKFFIITISCSITTFNYTLEHYTCIFSFPFISMAIKYSNLKEWKAFSEQLKIKFTLVLQWECFYKAKAIWLHSQYENYLHGSELQIWTISAVLRNKTDWYVVSGNRGSADFKHNHFGG